MLTAAADMVAAFAGDEVDNHTKTVADVAIIFIGLVTVFKKVPWTLRALGVVLMIVGTTSLILRAINGSL